MIPDQVHKKMWYILGDFQKGKQKDLPRSYQMSMHTVVTYTAVALKKRV